MGATNVHQCSAEAWRKNTLYASLHSCFFVYTMYIKKKVSHLTSQLGIFVFTFTVKRFHIYGALLHLALKVFTFTGPYYIFIFRGAKGLLNCSVFNMHGSRTFCQRGSKFDFFDLKTFF